MADEELELDEDEELSLLETLDHVLDHGLVVAGEVRISVAGIDLIFLGLNLLLGSVETVNRVLGERERRVELLTSRVTPAAADDAQAASESGQPTDERMSLYVYCLGDELTEAALDGLAGVGGARVRLLSLTERLSAAVSDAAGEPFAVTEENLTAHNRVNAAALAVSTPLPFRFGTSAAPERLREFAASNEAALAATLARVRGCVEMSVKLMEKAKGKGQQAEGKSEGAGRATGGTDTPAESSEAATVGRGTAFLLRKRREVLGEEEARARAEELAAWLAEGVGELARESAVRVSPPEAIVVRAAHLIGRERVGEYRTRLRELGTTRPGLRLLASGPWPPYSFAER